MVALLLPCAAANADVFMWKDPKTGKTQMTNIAPQWLREAKPGARIPKVEVIRDGKVLDPAAVFAAPVPPSVAPRRRTEEGDERAGEAVTGRAEQPGAVAGRTAVAERTDAPPTVPPGAQVPPGMMLVPVPPAQGAPASGTR